MTDFEQLAEKIALQGYKVSITVRDVSIPKPYGVGKACIWDLAVTDGDFSIKGMEGKKVFYKGCRGFKEVIEACGKILKDIGA